MAIKEYNWPCFFSNSDTTGEKPFEEFYTDKELPDFETFYELGRVKLASQVSRKSIDDFLHEFNNIYTSPNWKKSDLISLFQKVIPEFNHEELGLYLDQKM